MHAFTKRSRAGRWTGSSGDIFFTTTSRPSRYTNPISCVDSGRSRRSSDVAGVSATDAMRRQPRHRDGPHADEDALVPWSTSYAGEQRFLKNKRFLGCQFFVVFQCDVPKKTNNRKLTSISPEWADVSATGFPK